MSKDWLLSYPWECPRCHRMMAPFAMYCACNQQIEDVPEPTQFIDDGWRPKPAPGALSCYDCGTAYGNDDMKVGVVRLVNDKKIFALACKSCHERYGPGPKW